MQVSKRKLFKCATAGILIAAIAAVTAVPTLAADKTDSGTGVVNGSVAVQGNITPLAITVSFPVDVAYAVDPNTGTIVAPPVTVSNRSKVPVNVTVESLKSSSGGSIQFTDVLPEDKDWGKLNTADTKKYIALGLDITDAAGWNSGYNTSTDWAANNAAVKFGSLPAGASGALSLAANFGTAWDGSYTAQHSLVLKFDLV